MATMEETRKLNEEFGEVVDHLTFDTRSKFERNKGGQDEQFDSILAKLKTEG